MSGRCHGLGRGQRRPGRSTGHAARGLDRDTGPGAEIRLGRDQHRRPGRGLPPTGVRPACCTAPGILERPVKGRLALVRAESLHGARQSVRPGWRQGEHPAAVRVRALALVRADGLGNVRVRAGAGPPERLESLPCCLDGDSGQVRDLTRFSVNPELRYRVAGAAGTGIGLGFGVPQAYGGMEPSRSSFRRSVRTVWVVTPVMRAISALPRLGSVTRARRARIPAPGLRVRRSWGWPG